MFSEEAIAILLIEDSDTDARQFEFQIVKHPDLQRYQDVEIVHKKSLEEAFGYLVGNPPPYLICLDLGIAGLTQGNLRSTLKELGKYVPQDSVIGLSGYDTASIAKALEKVVGGDRVFNKQQDVLTDQGAILAAIREIISKRSSGTSREIQISQVRLEERLRQMQEELNELDKLSKRLNDTIFGGGANSIVAIALKYQQEAGGLVHKAYVDQLEARIWEIEKAQSQGLLQVRLARLGFVYKVVFALFVFLVTMGAVRFLGISIAEIIELVKAVMG